MTLTVTPNKHGIATWKDVSKYVEDNNGVVLLTMQVLRDIDGYGRLGTTVRANIAERLRLAGVGTIRGSRDLPANQYDTILLFKLGSPVAKVVQALHNVDHGVDIEGACDVLRTLNSPLERGSAIIAEVREDITTALAALDHTAKAVDVALG